MDFFIEGVKGEAPNPGAPLEGEPAPFEVSGTGAAEKPKVAFVYVGPVGDLGWSYAHDQGRIKMAEAAGRRDRLLPSWWPKGRTPARVIRDFAEKGYSPIFATSFGYMDSVIEVAADYPDTVFEHATGYKTADNVGIYDGRGYQGWYLAGIVAGSMTESNKLGYVAPYPIPEVVRNMNAFALGARSVNPDATVTPIWIFSWFDPPKEREAAQALYDSGVDVIARESDSVEPDKLAQEKGIYAIGYNAISADVAPDAVLTAPIWNWDVYYTQAVQDVMDGAWTSEPVWWGMAEGLLDLAPIADFVPQEVKDLVEAEKARIISGEFDVFVGPHQRQHGCRARRGRRVHDRRGEAELRLAGRGRARRRFRSSQHTRQGAEIRLCALLLIPSRSFVGQSPGLPGRKVQSDCVTTGACRRRQPDGLRSGNPLGLPGRNPAIPLQYRDSAILPPVQHDIIPSGRRDARHHQDFPRRVANEAVDLEVRAGEIHALLGENGAGKSTLMNILAGLYRQEAGEVWLHGQMAHIRSPKDAIDLGVGMVHQHFKLVETQTVAENVILGLKTPAFRLDMKRTAQEIKALGERYKMAVDPNAYIWQLGVGEQQRVEILKTLYRNADILILDEPTAVLTPQESEDLGQTLRHMIQEPATRGHAGNKAVIFITHKLDEVIRFSDRVTVLRGGKVEATIDTAGSSKADLARLMVGRTVLFHVDKPPFEPHVTPELRQEVLFAVRRSARPERQGAACPQRGHAGDPCRRDPGHRRRGRQRPARAGTVHHRTAQGHQGQGAGALRRHRGRAGRCDQPHARTRSSTTG